MIADWVFPLFPPYPLQRRGVPPYSVCHSAERDGVERVSLKGAGESPSESFGGRGRARASWGDQS